MRFRSGRLPSVSHVTEPAPEHLGSVRDPGNNHAMFGGRLAVALGLVLVTHTSALADPPNRCVDVQFTPTDKLQIVAWVETPAGDYVDTIYITQQTGTFGLGNRPGRFDFNSGPNWPYGRRITTFPVWSHANGQTFRR